MEDRKLNLNSGILRVNKLLKETTNKKCKKFYKNIEQGDRLVAQLVMPMFHCGISGKYNEVVFEVINLDKNDIYKDTYLNTIELLECFELLPGTDYLTGDEYRKEYKDVIPKLVKEEDLVAGNVYTLNGRVYRYIGHYNWYKGQEDKGKKYLFSYPTRAYVSEELTDLKGLTVYLVENLENMPYSFEEVLNSFLSSTAYSPLDISTLVTESLTLDEFKTYLEEVFKIEKYESTIAKLSLIKAFIEDLRYCRTVLTPILSKNDVEVTLKKETDNTYKIVTQDTKRGYGHYIYTDTTVEELYELIQPVRYSVKLRNGTVFAQTMPYEEYYKLDTL